MVKHRQLFVRLFFFLSVNPFFQDDFLHLLHFFKLNYNFFFLSLSVSMQLVYLHCSILFSLFPVHRLSLNRTFISSSLFYSGLSSTSVNMFFSIFCWVRWGGMYLFPYSCYPSYLKKMQLLYEINLLYNWWYLRFVVV